MRHNKIINYFTQSFVRILNSAHTFHRREGCVAGNYNPLKPLCRLFTTCNQFEYTTICSMSQVNIPINRLMQCAIRYALFTCLIWLRWKFLSSLIFLYTSSRKKQTVEEQVKMAAGVRTGFYLQNVTLLVSSGSEWCGARDLKTMWLLRADTLKKQSWVERHVRETSSEVQRLWQSALRHRRDRKAAEAEYHLLSNMLITGQKH